MPHSTGESAATRDPSRYKAAPICTFRFPTYSAECRLAGYPQGTPDQQEGKQNKGAVLDTGKKHARDSVTRAILDLHEASCKEL